MQEVVHVLPVVPEAAEAKQQYEALHTALHQFVESTHAEWYNSLQGNFAPALGNSLLLQDKAQNGLLIMNFDKELMKMLQEVRRHTNCICLLGICLHNGENMRQEGSDSKWKPACAAGQLLGAHEAQHSLYGDGGQCSEGALQDFESQCTDSCAHVQQGENYALSHHATALLLLSTWLGHCLKMP